MNTRLVWILVLALVGIAGAATYPFMPAISKRKVKVVRKYNIMVQPDQTNIAQIPAMISFQGVTNEQIIESSVFSFSIKPDDITIVCHDYGMPRKMYQMTWGKPSAISIEVKQEMVVSMVMRNRLFTLASLPYPEEVMQKQKSCLGKSRDGDINPDNPALGPICDSIVRQGRKAELVAAGVCDWIIDHIEHKRGEAYSSDETLEKRSGSSFAMTNLACSMLRRVGIPSDRLRCKYIDGNVDFFIIEVYFPDAGWVFYDVGWPERGFKSLDCLMASGWGYLVKNKTQDKFEWVEANFCDEWDVMKYQESEVVTKKAIRSTPDKKDALSVVVLNGKPPAGLPVRQQSLRELLLDPNTLPPPVVEKKATDKGDASDSGRPEKKVRKEKE
jgi:hypothetical protein